VLVVGMARHERYGLMAFKAAVLRSQYSVRV
jgi:hypothetical protein